MSYLVVTVVFFFRLRAAFGAESPLAEITAARIADYKLARLRVTVKRDGAERPITPATLNRELAALRHLFRLAVDEWDVLDQAPRIRLEREPEGRIAWLETDEQAALSRRVRASPQNPHLAASCSWPSKPACGRPRSSARRGSASTSPAA